MVTVLGGVCLWLTLTQSSLKFFSNEGYPFQRGDDSNKKCMHLQFLNTFSFRTTWPITTELGTKMSLVKGIQICSMRENNDTMKKIDALTPLKVFSTILVPISTKLYCHKASLHERDISLKGRVHPFLRGDQIILTFWKYMNCLHISLIIICH